MSHFYGTIQGGRSAATRCGHKNTGIEATAAAWGGAVTVDLVHNSRTGEDIAHVRLRPWQGNGVSKTLYLGPVDKFDPRWNQED